MRSASFTTALPLFCYVNALHAPSRAPDRAAGRQTLFPARVRLATMASPLPSVAGKDGPGSWAGSGRSERQSAPIQKGKPEKVMCRQHQARMAVGPCEMTASPPHWHSLPAHTKTGSN